MSAPLPGAAQTVIIGGGVIGCSTAYHLAKEGARDVILLERAQLTSGTTWHSAAMVRQLRSTASLTTLARYSAELYQNLEAETGLSSGWIGCGSLSIAANPDRLTHIRRQASLARAFGIAVEEIDADEIARLWPIANTSDLTAGILSVGDGRVSASDLCQALIRGATRKGVQVFENTPVTGFRIENGRIAGVDTATGVVACETVVLCAGLWSRELAGKVGVDAPLHACEHLALITKPFEGIYPGMPILGDHDGHMYLRDEGGGLLVGCFEPNAKPVDLEDLPANFAFDLLAENWEQFEPVMGGAIHRVPALETAEVRTLLNGPESFTPDNSFMLGEAPGLGGFFMCCGMNSVGVASAGGAGRALAEWVIDGEPTMDLTAVDVRRFAPVQNSIELVRARSAEVLSSHYLIGYPGREMQTGRNLRLSPLHERLTAHGAFFGERAGWERPNWFAGPGETPVNDLTFARPRWHDNVAREHHAARDAVALFDLSPYGKLTISDTDCVAFLQRVCANDVDVAPGRLVYTPILNRRGGFESDVVLLRTGADAYTLVTGTAQPIRDAHWLRRQRRAGETVKVEDVTETTAVIGLMGPRSRELLARVTRAPLDNAAFPYLTHAPIAIAIPMAGATAGATVRAARVSFVGELGWELHVPTANALAVYDALWEAGADLGLVDAGTSALASLRIEKGFCSFGHDIGPGDSPLEAGLGFACKLTSDHDFTGREALERQRREGLARRRILVAPRDPAVQLIGNEPILVNERIVGYVTSAAYGHTLGRAVAMGYVQTQGQNPRSLLRDAHVELEVALETIEADASLRAWVDPAGDRPRAPQ